MNKMIVGAAALLAVSAAATTSAQAAPWCAFYGSSTYNCGFHSFEQCQATVRGAGGWCRPNFFEGNTGARRQSSRRSRRN
jgi:hypothetical protein